MLKFGYFQEDGYSFIGAITRLTLDFVIVGVVIALIIG